MAQKPTLATKQGTPTGKLAPRPHSFYRDDFPVIRIAVITFGASIILSATLVIGTGYLLTKQQEIRNQAQAQQSQIHEKYREADTEKTEIQSYQPKYVQLIERGFIGEEKRLDWIEHIRSIQEGRKLLPITYDISPQQIVPPDPSFQLEELELRGSKMQVQMKLLHELDLLNFLNDLKTAGLYSLQACTIDRPDSIISEPLAPRLNADCTLYWITLGKHVDGTEPSPATAR